MSATTDFPAQPVLDAARDRRRLVELTASKKATAADLDNIKKQIAEVEERIIEHLGQEGLQNVKDASSGKTIYIKRRIYARPTVDRPIVCAAMKNHDKLRDYVEEGFNVNSLSAYFKAEAARIAEETGEPVTDLTTLLPDDLRDLIALTEDYTLGVTAG